MVRRLRRTPQLNPQLNPQLEPAVPRRACAGRQLTIADVRRLWPEILDKIRDMRRFAWIMLSQNAQVTGLDNSTLTIALVNTGARDSFISSGSDEYVQRALHEVLGVTWRIEAIVDPSVQPGVPDDDERSAPAARPAAPTPPPVRAPDSVREAMSEPHAREARADPDASADRNDPVVDDREPRSRGAAQP